MKTGIGVAKEGSALFGVWCLVFRFNRSNVKSHEKVTKFTGAWGKAS